jgi:hypothetical protein
VSQEWGGTIQSQFIRVDKDRLAQWKTKHKVVSRPDGQHGRFAVDVISVSVISPDAAEAHNSPNHNPLLLLPAEQDDFTPNGDDFFCNLGDLDSLIGLLDKEQDGQQPNENGAAELMDFFAMPGDK